MHSRSRPRKRSRPKGVKPLTMAIVTHSVFEEAQGFQKCSKMDARMESLGTESHKIHHIQNSNKKKRSNHKTVKNGLLCAFEGGSAKALFSIKTHIHLRNPENKSPGLQNDCPGLKTDPQALKVTARVSKFTIQPWLLL